jgi:hypothetical protein
MPHQILYKPCLRGYTPYAGGLRSSLTEWIIQWIAHKRKLANIFIVFRAMKKSYLILHIIYAYNVHISRLRSEDATPITCSTSVGRCDSDHMPNSCWKMWFQMYAQLRSYDWLPLKYVTPVERHNSSHVHNSSRKTRLWLYARLQSENMTLVEHHDSGWTSWLQL